METVVVHPRVMERHPELSEDDVREAWEGYVRMTRREREATITFCDCRLRRPRPCNRDGGSGNARWRLVHIPCVYSADEKRAPRTGIDEVRLWALRQRTGRRPPGRLSPFVDLVFKKLVQCG